LIPRIVLLDTRAVPSLAALAVLAIVEIVVEGNRKTTDATVREISDLQVGAAWTDAARRHAEDELVTSGLFSEVDVSAAERADGAHVTLRVKDKHSWVIAPAFYWQPTNRGAGLGFGENNLFGRNEKLLLYGQVATGDSFFIGAYVDPSVGGGPWRFQLDLYLRSVRSIEYASPRAWRDDPAPVRQSRLRYLNGGVRLGRELRDGAAFELRGRAAEVGFSDVALVEGATAADVGVAPGEPIPAPGAAGWDVSGELLATYDDRTNYWGVADGTRAVFTYERTVPGISDFAYWYTGAVLSHAVALPRAHNLVLRGALGLGADLPFQQEYSIGGTSHRGLEGGQLRGDQRAQAGVEYSVPAASWRGFSLRAMGFVDAGYATFRDVDEGDRDLRHYLPGADADGWAPYKTSIGVGTRVYLRRVVLPLLGLDFGYGVERRAYEIYLAVGLVD
jgi:outer membrane protein assembly factor BamA